MTTNLLTLSQAAKIAGAHVDTIRRWCVQGMPHTWTDNNKSRLVAHEDLQERLKSYKPQKPKRKQQIQLGRAAKENGRKRTTSQTNILPGRMTCSPEELRRNRERIDEIAKRAKTAVRIRANGSRQAVERALTQ